MPRTPLVGAAAAALVIALCATPADAAARAAGKTAPKTAAKATATPAARKWVCAPCGDDHDKVEYDHPGSCPSCGMALVEKAPEPTPPPKPSPQAKSKG